MVPVRYRDMAAALTVHMVMRLMHHVAGRLAFVVVTLMLSMKVAVVHVVDMIPVWDRDVTTSFAVRMIMRTVLVVGRLGHYFSPPIPEFDSRDHGPTEAKRSPLALHRARIFTVPDQWFTGLLTASNVGLGSIASTGAAGPEMMPDELRWQGCVLPLPQLQPVPQDRCVSVVSNRADPVGWPTGHPVIRAGLQQSQDAASRRARCAGEWSEHARRGDEHAPWTGVGW